MEPPRDPPRAGSSSLLASSLQPLLAQTALPRSQCFDAWWYDPKGPAPACNPMAHFAGRAFDDIVRSGTVLQVRTLAGRLLLEWSPAENTDVGTRSLALTICAARTLRVPRRCLFMTWLLPASVAARATTPGTVVPITCTVMDIDEDFLYTDVDYECFCCGDPCEDADDACAPRSRVENCERCQPCLLCEECSFQFADRSCCPLCLTVEDLPRLTPRQMRRACLVRPALRA